MADFALHALQWEQSADRFYISILDITHHTIGYKEEECYVFCQTSLEEDTKMKTLLLSMLIYGVIIGPTAGVGFYFYLNDSKL